jgi:polysaccharide biosynthesis transport protein
MAPELHLPELLAILRRRRGMIIATAVIGTSLVLFGSLMIPPRYTAKAQIVFETGPAYPGDGKPVTVQPDEEAVLQTHIAGLTSRAYLERVIDSLSQDSDFRAAKSQSRREAQWIGDVLWLEFGARLQEVVAQLFASARQQGQSPTEPALRLDRFERALNIYQEHGSHVIAVAFGSTSPDQAALAANRVAQLYIASEDERKRTQTSGAMSWLDEQIPAAKGELEQAETALQNYRMAHGLPDPHRTDLSDQNLADLTRQLTDAESEYAKRQAKLASVRDLQRRGSDVEGLVKNLDSPAHAELLQQEVAVLQSRADIAGTLGEEHPKTQHLAAELQEVRRKLANEVELAIDGLKNEVQIAGDQVNSIRERLAKLQAANAQAQQAEPRLRELERNAAAAGQLYEGLLQRREQLRAQQAEMLPDLRMLSVASPPDRPSSYSPLLFILPSLIICSIGGGLLAVTAERLDRGLRSDQDINAALGIPCMGFVPLIRHRGKTRPHEYLLQNPYAAYAEAIRSVVAALQLAAPEVAPKLTLISSSVPNEGKTTLAVSFAVYAAFIGRRVLLVDLDFRHPGVARELRRQAETDVLDALSLDDLSAAAVDHFPGLDLDYLPMRGRQDDPLRRFVSGHVPRFLGKLRDSYDCIIVDSPPLLAVAEARLLAAMADKVLLVVKWGSTQREMARDAANLLRDLGLLGGNRSGLVSAVLTQVNLKKYAQYRYGYGSSLRATRVLPPRTPKRIDEATSAGVRDAPPPLDTFSNGSPPAKAVPEQPSSPQPYRSRVTWPLWISVLATVALGGILFASGDRLLSLVHSAKQQIAGFAPFDFGAWVQPSRDKNPPANAGDATPAESVAPPAAVEQETPTPSGTGSMAAAPEDQRREGSAPPSSPALREAPKEVPEGASSTNELAPPQPTPGDMLGKKHSLLGQKRHLHSLRVHL